MSYYRMSILSLGLAVAVATGPASAIAKVTWAVHKEVVNCPLGAAEAVATFGFENTGTRAITVEQISTSCSCTKATVSRHVYQPGQSGQLRVHVTIGNLHGVLIRTVRVVTSGGGKEQMETLTLQARVPELAHIAPRSLIWRIGAPATPRMVIVTVPKSHPFRVVKVDTGDTFIRAKLVVIEPLRRYAILLWPKSTSGLGGWMVRVRTTFMLDGRPAWLTIPTEIFPPPATTLTR